MFMELVDIVNGFASALKIEGLSLESGGASAFMADGMWVGIADNTANRTFTLTGRIGEPPPGGRERLDRLFLKMSALLSSKSGMSVGLDDEDRYVLMTTVEYAYLTTETFAEKVEAFLNELERLRTLVESYANSDQDIVKAEADSTAEAKRLSEGGFLRV